MVPAPKIIPIKAKPPGKKSPSPNAQPAVFEVPTIRRGMLNDMSSSNFDLSDSSRFGEVEMSTMDSSASMDLERSMSSEGGDAPPPELGYMDSTIGESAMEFQRVLSVGEEEEEEPPIQFSQQPIRPMGVNPIARSPQHASSGGGGRVLSPSEAKRSPNGQQTRTSPQPARGRTPSPPNGSRSSQGRKDLQVKTGTFMV
jgi:hypothetical protein